MVAQFIEDFIHLEGREHGFDEDSALDRAQRQAQFALRHHEDVVPQPRFKVAFHFRQIEVRAGVARDGFLGVMEYVECKVEDRSGDRFAVDMHVLFQQMPAARTHHQRRRLRIEQVLLAFGTLEGYRTPYRVAKIDLAFNHVAPGRRVGVLEIGHEHVGAAVQRIDHHLAVGGAGNFDAAILQVGRDRADAPFALADAAGLGQEIGQLTAIEPGLTGVPIT